MRRSALVTLLGLVLSSAACAPSNVISSGNAGSYETALAVVQNKLVAGWYDTRDGNAEIYIRALDEQGHPAGPERRVTSDAAASYEVSMDAAGPDVAVAWYDKVRGVYTSRLGVWDVDGRAKWTAVAAPHARNPVVRADANRVFCAWIQQDDDGYEAVWAGWWTTRGEVITAGRPLARASRTTWNLNATLDDSGDAWVVFDAMIDTRANELFVVHTGPGTDAAPVRLTSDDGFASTYPDLAIHGQRAALTWWDKKDGNAEVCLAAVDLARLTGSIDTVARRVTTTPGESIGAYVAWNGDRLGLAWNDNSEGQDEIYFQSFDRDARPAGAVRRLTFTREASLIPAIRPWRSGFALAWNEYEKPAVDGHDSGGGRSSIATAVVP